ncbi:MAG: hemerythrin domain-containing protein [Magnetococcales bacterium]|nr:hemerythrin domain-containing protein [Magnetococcales bacterium]
MNSLDSDHQHLLKLINAVLASFAAAKEVNTRDLTDQFDALLAFWPVHFRREEEILEATSYPELISHKKVHRFMEARLAQFRVTFLNLPPTPGNLATLHSRLEDWVLLHIQGVDKRYQPHLPSSPSPGQSS